jgi:hypothetical protein
MRLILSTARYLQQLKLQLCVTLFNDTFCTLSYVTMMLCAAILQIYNTVTGWLTVRVRHGLMHCWLLHCVQTGGTQLH